MFARFLYLLPPDLLKASQFLNFGTEQPPVLEIVSNAVTVMQSWHWLSATGTNSERTLNIINGGTRGDLVIFQRALVSGGSVIISSDGGNMWTAGAFTMDNPNDTIVFLYVNPKWVEICRSNNA